MELSFKNRRSKRSTTFLLFIAKIFFSVIISCFTHASAQVIQPINLHRDSTESSVVPPAFKDGGDAWFQFLEKNMHVGVLENDKVPSGRYVVVASFTINTKGKISDIFIEKDPGYGTGNDAKRVLKQCPRWIPATRNGIKIPYRLTQSMVYLKTE